MIKLKIKYGNSQTDLRFPCTEKEMNADQIFGYVRRYRRLSVGA